MRRYAVGICLAALAAGSNVGAQGGNRIHELKPSPTTVQYGFYDATLPPVLTIDSGDTVRIWTATGHPRWFERLGVPSERIPAELRAVFAGVENEGRGDHTLTGPIAVRGAEPGDAVEIRIRSVDLWLPIAGQGVAGRGVGVVPEDAPRLRNRVLWIDLERKTIEYAPGVVVPARPFWGDVGVAPPREKGRWPANCPDIHGGNLDNRDLGAGSSLFLPVHVPGALIAIGDGHAAQGNGEVAVSAVETSLRGEVQIILHKGMRLVRPRAETATHYISMAIHADLDEAAKLATRDMIEFLVETKKLDFADAYMVASASMDLAVTQAVDCVKGIHALMPKAVFTR